MGRTQTTRLVRLALVCLLAAPGTPADTIVLKNGKRIAALSVTREGDKVSYETQSGTLILPSSLVDHIERGGVRSTEGQADATKLSLQQPETEAATASLSPIASEIEKRVVQNGEVDRNYVAQLEVQAHSGQAVANQNAALAHHVAAQFELAHSEMDLA